MPRSEASKRATHAPSMAARSELRTSSELSRLTSVPSRAYGGKPTSIRRNQPAACPFEQYFWRGGVVAFDGHYSVGGKPAEKAIHAEFYVPPHPRDQIQPSN